MHTLKLVSLMADNMHPTYQAIAGYLSRQSDVRVELVADAPWQEREQMLDRGEVQAGFICGLPYVRKVAQPDPLIELLAAPVMQAARYEDRPVYFSDVVVCHDSPFHSFADLRGAAWAYNEPGSMSGHCITRYHLATLGEDGSFFGRVVGSGVHQRSLRMVIAGEVDASAIDSTVLEMEFRLHPELARQVRVIETFGPSPIPPLVVARRLPATLKQSLRAALLHMHEAGEGRDILAKGDLARFVVVSDADYDDIRRKLRLAEGVSLI